MSFEQWIEAVDALLIDLFMMDSSTMEDWGWRDAHSDGMLNEARSTWKN